VAAEAGHYWAVRPAGDGTFFAVDSIGPRVAHKTADDVDAAVMTALAGERTTVMVVGTLPSATTPEDLRAHVRARRQLTWSKRKAAGPAGEVDCSESDGGGSGGGGGGGGLSRPVKRRRSGAEAAEVAEAAEAAGVAEVAAVAEAAAAAEAVEAAGAAAAVADGAGSDGATDGDELTFPSAQSASSPGLALDTGGDGPPKGSLVSLAGGPYGDGGATMAGGVATVADDQRAEEGAEWDPTMEVDDVAVMTAALGKRAREIETGEAARVEEQELEAEELAAIGLAIQRAPPTAGMQRAGRQPSRNERQRLKKRRRRDSQNE